MSEGHEALTRRVLSGAIAGCAAVLMAIVMTWPLASDFGNLGRVDPDNADGMYAVWNVSWVARTLVEEPRQLFAANIFHPHRSALAFSEINLFGGIVGIPGWMLTQNPYVAHNSALLFAFSTSALGAWLLAARLSGSRAAAVVAGLVFAFCPYFFAHTSHIQLLMGGGIPLSLVMLHALADAPSIRRGVLLGLTLAAQALASAYYGIFAGLMVGYAVLFLAVSRGLWRQRGYWTAVAVAMSVAVACVAPFFMPFLDIRTDGFQRSLDDSRLYSANVASYLASSAHAHRWLLEESSRFGGWNEVLFPGVVALLLGGAGLGLGALAPRRGDGGVARDRETALLYGSIGALALWVSFGPGAGLYTALFNAVPLMSFLRAPSRFGVVVPLVLGVLASLALVRMRPRVRTAASVGVGALAAFELNTLPFPWDRAPRLPQAYELLARLPRGPVAEFPFYGQRPAFHLHTRYMLFSTTHWQPLVNGYSDHIPAEFRESALLLESFPSSDSFAVLRRRRVRYIALHWNMFGRRADEIRARLNPYAHHLRRLAGDDLMTLYEVMSFP